MHRRLQSAKLSGIVQRKNQNEKYIDLSQKDSKMARKNSPDKFEMSRNKASGSFKI